MSTKPNGNEFEAIALDALKNVAGGAARTSSGDSEVTAALSSITNSIKDLAANKNQGGMDPMMMIMMMMMMGGGGGGGGGYIGAPAVGTPPVINVDTGVSGGGGWGGGCGRGKGKKGW